MAGKSEDDFWNTSSSLGFNFDDDEDTSEPFSESVFNSPTEESSVVPIFSIISKNCLDLVLDDIKSVNEYVTPPVEEIIKKIFNGQKYSLEVYKKFDEKLLLLDSALDTMDGNIILKVILFLKSTLKRNIFSHQLSKRKVAVKYYADYLIVTNQFGELTDIYMATGNSGHMKQLYYLIGRDVSCKDTLYKRLDQFMNEHMPKLDHEDKKELFENMQLLHWQTKTKQTANSVIEQLAAWCRREWEGNINSMAPVMDFKQKFKVDDFAFEWTLMNVMASMQMWPQLAALFIKPNWLTKKDALKTVMTPEVFVYGLSRHKPPKEVLEQYLHYISDSDRSMNLAQKLNCHKFIVQHYINQRDRLALVGYKGKLAPQTEEYFMVEHALQSADKKWKN
ncbi:spermatogenesis-defective protein 39 homolog [Anoplophora glabripennis]|uniref:spermatogenesis-defective protein 39 homolog n=1 Tax=Anoplophora glabripennis TaxID=217634 RepID=UPI00087431D4|nr:spermatogenesis-defective protein 39 homolog [Anoplophora glabripennis]